MENQINMENQNNQQISQSSTNLTVGVQKKVNYRIVSLTMVLLLIFALLAFWIYTAVYQKGKFGSQVYRVTTPTPTRTPSIPAPTDSIWDEMSTVNSWEENGNVYKSIGYVHKEGIPWIYKNGQKFIEISKLPLKGPINSIWASEKENVLFAVEDSTEKMGEGGIEFSNRIVKISLKDNQRQEFLKEPVPAFHGGLRIEHYYADIKKLLVVFASGGPCSVSSEIWLIDTQKQEKRTIKETGFKLCGDKDDGGIKNLGYNGENFILINVDKKDNSKSRLFLFNPLTEKEEIILTGVRLPLGVNMESGTLNIEKKSVVAFQLLDGTLQGGEKYSFDIEKRNFVE